MSTEDMGHCPNCGEPADACECAPCMWCGELVNWAAYEGADFCPHCDEEDEA